MQIRCLVLLDYCEKNYISVITKPPIFLFYFQQTNFIAVNIKLLVRLFPYGLIL